MIYGIILLNLIFLHHHPDEVYVEEIWESLAIGCAFISLAIQICSNLLHPSSYLVLLRWLKKNWLSGLCSGFISLKQSYDVLQFLHSKVDLPWFVL